MPFTPNRDFKHDPKLIVRAEGMYYWNDRGEKIIDASSGLFCVAAGHCRKEIADAVSRQLQELDFCAPFLRGHPKQFELATRVAELTPGDLNRIFFVNSGSEAIDTAMKVVLAYHQARGQGGRTMFVSRERAYHGVNFGGVSLSGWSTTAAASARRFPASRTCATRTCPRTASCPGKARMAPISPRTFSVSSISTARRT
jgi:beta-alanine--pyruvate transaminase